MSEHEVPQKGTTRAHLRNFLLEAAALSTGSNAVIFVITSLDGFRQICTADYSVCMALEGILPRVVFGILFGLGATVVHVARRVVTGKHTIYKMDASKIDKI